MEIKNKQIFEQQTDEFFYWILFNNAGLFTFRAYRNVQEPKWKHTLKGQFKNAIHMRASIAITNMNLLHADVENIAFWKCRSFAIVCTKTRIGEFDDCSDRPCANKLEMLR